MQVDKTLVILALLYPYQRSSRRNCTTMTTSFGYDLLLD